jgi:hypothetical protein
MTASTSSNICTNNTRHLFLLAEAPELPNHFVENICPALNMIVICISRAYFYNLFVCWGYSGKIFPSGVAADSYKKAVDSAIEKLSQEANRGGGSGDLTEPAS